MVVTKYTELREEVLDRFGRRCMACGYPDTRALQVDHVFGGGADERRQFKNGVTYLRHILANLDSGRYQLLCCNCNWLKRITNFETRRINVEVIDDLEALANEYEEPPP